MNLKTISRRLDAIRDVDHARIRTGVLRWVKVCIDHPSRPDGYPTSASGAPPSTNSTPAPEHDDNGNPYTPTDTITERAALTTRSRDHIEMNTAAIVGWVTQIDDLFRRIEAKLLENERLQSTADLNPEPACWFMAQIDVYEPKHVKTDFAGVLDKPLDEPRYVGRWCYDYIRATGTIPTREQRRQHASGQRVMVAA